MFSRFHSKFTWALKISNGIFIGILKEIVGNFCLITKETVSCVLGVYEALLEGILRRFSRGSKRSSVDFHEIMW